MTPIAKLYALLESNGIYDEAISLLKEHSRSRVMENDSQYDRLSQKHVVIDVNGKPMRITANDLPVNSPRGIGSPLMKLKLIVLIDAGLFSYEEAKKRYDMSREELDSWVDRYKKYGVDGIYSQKTGEKETKKLKDRKSEDYFSKYLFIYY